MSNRGLSPGSAATHPVSAVAWQHDDCPRLHVEQDAARICPDNPRRTRASAFQVTVTISRRVDTAVTTD